MAEVTITMPIKYTIILDKRKITLTENHRVVFSVDLEKIPWCASIEKLKDFIYTFLDNAIQEYLYKEAEDEEEKKGQENNEEEEEGLPWWRE